MRRSTLVYAALALVWIIGVGLVLLARTSIGNIVLRERAVVVAVVDTDDEGDTDGVFAKGVTVRGGDAGLFARAHDATLFAGITDGDGDGGIAVSMIRSVGRQQQAAKPRRRTNQRRINMKGGGDPRRVAAAQRLWSATDAQLVAPRGAADTRVGGGGGDTFMDTLRAMPDRSVLVDVLDAERALLNGVPAGMCGETADADDPNGPRMKHRNNAGSGREGAVVKMYGHQKSGTTWLEQLAVSLMREYCATSVLHPCAVEASDGGDVGMYVVRHTSAADRDRCGLRFTAAAKHFSLANQLDVRERALLILRDPRDVLVSEYYYDCMDAHTALGEYASRMAAKVVDWQACNYVTAVRRRALVVQYECMAADAIGEAARIATFLGMFDAPYAVLERAVARASMGEMHALEARGELAGVPDFKQLVRRGVAGGYRSESGFDDEAALRVWRLMDRGFTRGLADFYRRYDEGSAACMWQQRGDGVVDDGGGGGYRGLYASEQSAVRAKHAVLSPDRCDAWIEEGRMARKNYYARFGKHRCPGNTLAEQPSAEAAVDTGDARDARTAGVGGASGDTPLAA